jgi:hypothetical protein
VDIHDELDMFGWCHILPGDRLGQSIQWGYNQAEFEMVGGGSHPMKDRLG